MREFVGMAGVAILFSGFFMLYDKLSKADSVQRVSSDERVNECVEKWFRDGSAPRAPIRLLACECQIRHLDASFAPVERDILIRSFGSPDFDASFRGETKNFSVPEMKAFGERIDHYLAVAGPQCLKEIIAAQ